MRPTILAVTFVAALFPALALSQVPVGPEFQVNTFTTGYQYRPQIASDGADNFVVVWGSEGQDGNTSGAFARRYDATGAPIGAAEFRINAFTLGVQGRPAVAAAPDGRLGFAWHTQNQDGSGFGVYSRRFDALGVPAGGESRVNTFTTGDQWYPSISIDANGNSVVVWNGPDGSGSGLFGQRFDAAGTAQGGEFRVNSHTTSNQQSTYRAVSASANGSFVVVWGGPAPDGTQGILAQRYDAAGVAVGAEFQVNVYNGGSRRAPAVAADPTGNFVVVWLALFHPGGSPYDILGRRFDASGVPLGGEFIVNNVNDAAGSAYPSVAMDARGGFVAAWHGDGPYDFFDVFAREFDSAGPTGPQFRVGTYTGLQKNTSVASSADGDFVVAWQGNDGSSYGIFARRFLSDRIFKDDFETGSLAAWSASATDGGDLSVNSAAALDFTVAGLQGVVNDVAAIYVQDDSPHDEPRYRARFWIDPNGFDPGVPQGHLRTRVFIAFTDAPTRRVAAIVLRLQSGVYGLMGRARLDDNEQADTGFFPISDGPHAVEIDLTPATDPAALDGSFALYVDGVMMGRLRELDNSLGAVDFVRMGALSAKVGARGTMYWDEFESRRQTDIGF